MKLSTGLELVGTALIAYGLWQIWRPLTWLFVGAMCFVASYLLELELAKPSVEVLPPSDDGRLDDGAAPRRLTDDEWMTRTS